MGEEWRKRGGRGEIMRERERGRVGDITGGGREGLREERGNSGKGRKNNGRR